MIKNEAWFKEQSETLQKLIKSYTADMKGDRRTATYKDAQKHVDKYTIALQHINLEYVDFVLFANNALNREELQAQGHLKFRTVEVNEVGKSLVEITSERSPTFKLYMRPNSNSLGFKLYAPTGFRESDPMWHHVDNVKTLFEVLKEKLNKAIEYDNVQKINVAHAKAFYKQVAGDVSRRSGAWNNFNNADWTGDTIEMEFRGNEESIFAGAKCAMHFRDEKICTDAMLRAEFLNVEDAKEFWNDFKALVQKHTRYIHVEEDRGELK